MGDPSHKRVPKVVPGIDLVGLPLGPTEGFVLSRVDGMVSLQDIADMTSIPVDRVLTVVDQLTTLGAVEWVESRGRASATFQATPPASEERPTMAARESKRAPEPTPPVVVPVAEPPKLTGDAAALEEDVELPMERRKQIIDTYNRLEHITHYELLGVPRNAEKVAIRTAYFELSKAFHPDTMFRRRLGTYKEKMERVFRHLTDAYETLGKMKARAEYDAYLLATAHTRAIEDSLGGGASIPPTPASRGPEASGVRSAVESARAPSSQPARPPSSPAVRPPSSPSVRAPSSQSLPVMTPSSSNPPSSARGTAPPVRELDADQKRERMMRAARNMARATGNVTSRDSSNVGKRASDSTPGRPAAGATRSSDTPATDRVTILRELTSSLVATSAHTGLERTDRCIDAAERAEAAGDLIAAANAMRIAVSISATPDLIRRHEALRRRVAVELADTYRLQAEYEERTGKMGAAAISWARAAEGRPDDAEAHLRGARCMLAVGGDIARAKSLGERATELMPKSVEARVLLAEIYLVAGLQLNARREVQAALALDPNDKMVENLRRRIGL